MKYKVSFVADIFEESDLVDASLEGSKNLADSLGDEIVSWLNDIDVDVSELDISEVE